MFGHLSGEWDGENETVGVTYWECYGTDVP